MRTVVVIPTYNEAQNLESIVARTRAAVPAASILVVDDNSPDGTGRIAQAIAAVDSNVTVLHRAGKAGLGAAYLDGFRQSMDRGFQIIVSMDADGSHRPEQLPRLLQAIETSHVAVGSRWVRGGTVTGWPLTRRLISLAGSLYARVMLGLSVRDVTGGFRAYRASTLERIGLSSVESRGYCFQIDLLRRASAEQLRIAEVPITFADRTAGQSKMSSSILAEALLRVTKWALQGQPAGTSTNFLTYRLID